MKQSFLFCLLAIFSLFGHAQISQKNNWLAYPDKEHTQLNIFDTKTGEVVKSIFVGEKIRNSQFSEDDSKLYILTKNFLFVTDLTSFEKDKKALLSNLAIGITKKGKIVYYGGPFVDFEKRTITYVFQDIFKTDMIVDRLTEPHMGVYFDDKLIIPLLDGGLKIIQVDSKESGTIEATIDTAILNNYVANHPDQPLELSIQSFGNTVLTDVLEGRIKSVNIYNLQTKKIDYAESFLFKFEQPAVNPVACYDNKGVYYVQYTPINSNASAPQRPEYPQEPDYATMNAKDVKKAEKDYHTKQLKYENELTRYEELYTSYVAPENNIAHVYSDVKGVKEILQIPQAKKITIYGDILIAEKENNIDVYDIKTGKLKLTLTPPSP